MNIGYIIEQERREESLDNQIAQKYLKLSFENLTFILQYYKLAYRNSSTN